MAAAKAAVETVTALASVAAAMVASADSRCLVEVDIEAAETDRKYLAVVAAARADYSVVVAQGSPLFMTTQYTSFTLGEMRNMRKITTTGDG